jgi:hypothetical protein
MRADVRGSLSIMATVELDPEEFRGQTRWEIVETLEAVMQGTVPQDIDWDQHYLLDVADDILAELAERADG